MRETIQRRCHTFPIEKLAIKKAELGIKAGVMGAALYACQES
jgi:hypothetical protein